VGCIELFRGQLQKLRLKPIVWLCCWSDAIRGGIYAGFKGTVKTEKSQADDIGRRQQTTSSEAVTAGSKISKTGEPL
jgi:hypothetical protein